MSKETATIQSTFTKASKTYDAQAHIQRDVHRGLLDQIGDSVSLSVRRILDLGCGTGYGTLLLQERFPGIPIMGVDFAPDMIAYAREHHRNPFIQYDCQDILDLKVDFLYELIFSNATLHWCDPPETAIKNIKAYLNTGGTLAFSVFGPRTFWELGDCLSAVSEHHYPLMSEKFWDAEKWQSLLTNEFKSVKIQKKTINKSFDNLVGLLCHIKHTGTRGVVQQKSFWTPGFMKKCQAEFERRFGEVQVSYDVFYCIARL